ncbi:MAG TPA: hypothetical protein VEP66_14960 [Myxococcales bacterium]|nr:hypothetical protein [Myxococcales bacterium]
MSMRFIAALGAAAFAWACSSSEQKTLQLTDARVDALFNAPAGVLCIQIVASAPLRTANKTFSVTPGQSSSALSMNGIPTGTVMFSGRAFNQPCGFVDLITPPDWVADDLTVQVDPGPPISVQLNFHARANATVGANFGGDAYTVTTIAGVGRVPGTTDGVGSLARFAGPNNLALSADRTKLFVGDRNDEDATSLGMAIRMVDLATGAVTTIAGSLSELGTADGPGATARFSRLFSSVLSGSNLIIADRCAIRAMSTTPPFIVTTLLGTRASTDPNQWDCRPTVSRLGAQDLDLAVRGRDVYAADSTHFVVWKISFASTPPVISLVAGVPDFSGSDDGPIATAHLLGPAGLVFPFVSDDPFYLIESDSRISNAYGLVRQISPGFDDVITVAGAPQAGFVSTDGLGTQALFAQPRRAVSDGTSLFIGDIFSVRRMDLNTNAVVTIAGDMATTGFADGVGGAARFSAAFGIARDNLSGAIYVADQGNFAIRKLTAP